MKKPSALSIGTVSYGTMREEDLISAFLCECASIRLNKSERKAVNDIKKRAYAGDTESYYNSEDANDDCMELFALLDAYCPAYCYFGAREGDGCDYGCWPMIDIAIEELPTIQDATRHYRGYMVNISDHGNMTLYNRVSFGHGYKDIEVWGIV